MKRWVIVLLFIFLTGCGCRDYPPLQDTPTIEPWQKPNEVRKVDGYGMLLD